ncbi:MAG: F0F1 ATP synthase subunit epsilon [Oscillospiraceae bacterium]|nr:F0F1 ATP synthase subunit epsilon [Oscillospiraceae bacterium]
MDDLHLLLSCSNGESWEKRVCSVTLPAVNGSLGILRNHAPMLCALSDGTMSCRTEAGETTRIYISKGIASVADNEVTLLLSYMRVLE